MREPVRFYLDEHVGTIIRRGLRQRGIEVETVVEAGLLGESDNAHLAHAHATGRVIVTMDSDFLALHAEGHPHAGIAYTSQRTPRRRVLEYLLLLHAVMDAAEMVRRVEYL